MKGMELQEGDNLDFVEVDPSGRYGRYNEILGKGASKTVYIGFDDYEGIEVAWNQVRLCDFLQSSQDLERLYCEIHLLKSLNHKNIMKFYTSWVDTSKRNLNFITELFSSGTLRQYRQRHRRVNMRAVKRWCRQILRGLVYLHSRDPPVIHRDLKCDNIFINGNLGEVKIGDLGLAAILRKSKTVQCVGTPEFMAPEVYEEEYDELVDIYSFGMCVLEMVTFEYPYSECTHPAQIYKKVISGTKPEALYKVKDVETRQFIEKCLVTASHRLSSRELLKDPFLRIDGLGPVISESDIVGMGHILRRSCITPQHSNGSVFSNGLRHESELGYSDNELEIYGVELFNNQEEEHFTNMDITIKGRRKEDGGVFIRLRITDKDGRVRNIYFPFDVEADTAISVATEMVGELDITDYEVTRIAEMIDGEISSLVPGWKIGPGIDDSPRFSSKKLCQYCASNASSCSSLLDYMKHNSPDSENLQFSYCSNLECAAMHGRFEEITYQIEGSKDHRKEGDYFSSSGPDAQTISRKEVAGELWNLNMNSESKHHFEDEHDNEIQLELSWLEKNYRMEQMEYGNRQLDKPKEVRHQSSAETVLDQEIEDDRRECSLSCRSLRIPKDRQMKSFHLSNNCSFRIPDDDEKQDPDFQYPERSPKSVVAGNLLPPILRTQSLPVDAVIV